MTTQERKAKLEQFFDLVDELGMGCETDESAHNQIVIYTECKYDADGNAVFLTEEDF